MPARLTSALIVLAAFGGLAVACAPEPEREATPLQGTGVGIRIDWIDTAVDPGDDFFQYANGAWLEATRIPSDRASTGATRIVVDRTQERLGEIVADVVAGDPAEGTDEALIAAYYTAFLDREAIDRAGLKPVRGDLDRIAAIDDVAGLSGALGRQLAADVDPLNLTDFTTGNLFGLFVTKSLSDEAVIAYLLQGGLGMPGRDYYLDEDARSLRLRRAYRDYATKMLRQAGMARPQYRAERIIALETAIAQAHLPRAVSESFANGATIWSRDDLARNAPGIDWDAFLKAARLDKEDRFGAYHAAAIARLSALVASEPLDVWRDWMILRLLERHAAVLPAPFDRAHFDFFDKRLAGVERQRPRRSRAIEALTALFPDALGRLYVERHFSAEQRRDVEIMIANVRDAFATQIAESDWLAPPTRQEALDKLAGLEISVGYPDRFAGYAQIDPAGKSLYAMTVAAERAHTRAQVAKLARPFDRSEWWMPAQTVNAMNLPVANAIQFPAAILQPPFYDPDADPAANYGAIGATIGHEIVHAFDDDGARFDANGNLRNWWSDADLATFRSRGQALSQQVSAYRPFPDAAVNGALTLGENIADLAGLRAAYNAYRASLDGKEPPVIEGFTGDQRFFIAYAQSWADKVRDAALRRQLEGGVHAPPRYRALVVRNLDAWYRAFDVSEDDALFLPVEERIRIW